ncbi:MAG: rod shape-determining protein MreD [Christensenella sp.]
MRYVVLVAMSILGTILSGSVFSNINLWGLQIDIVLIMILALVLTEKTAMPVIFAAVTGLLMDITYSTVLGMYAVSYTVAAAVAFMVLRKTEKQTILHLFFVGVGGYIIKESVMAFIVFAQGARNFDFFAILARYILPSAALCGGLLILAYFLISRLYKNAWMRPRTSGRYMDEL